jgi:hypothetical protein
MATPVLDVPTNDALAGNSVKAASLQLGHFDVLRASRHFDSIGKSSRLSDQVASGVNAR